MKRKLKIGHQMNDGWLDSVRCFLAGVLLMNTNRLKAELRAPSSWRFTVFGVPPSGDLSAIRGNMSIAGFLVFGLVLACCRLGLSPLVAAPGAAAFRESSPGVEHARDVIESEPWSIQIVRLNRHQRDLEFRPMLGFGSRIGLNRLTSQLRLVPREVGRPVAAINGDFYKTEHEAFPGDPRGLFVSGGDLISAPSGGAVFWIGSEGAPRMGEVDSAFEVTVPGGDAVSLGFNEVDGESQAVLFTSAVGAMPMDRRGLVVALESTNEVPLTPIRLGQATTARVAVIRPGGSRIEPAKPWLWLATSSKGVREIKVGSLVTLSFLSTPALNDVKTAIGGGPLLVRGGKALRVTTNKAGQRHPRSALGWNAAHIFLVTVDGRQPGHSVGMTLPELGAYMKSLGCLEAMNLDGGGSTELWMNGRILNNPCYGHERETATSLVVVRKESGRPAGASNQAESEAAKKPGIKAATP